MGEMAPETRRQTPLANLSRSAVTGLSLPATARRADGNGRAHAPSTHAARGGTRRYAMTHRRFGLGFVRRCAGHRPRQLAGIRARLAASHRSCASAAYEDAEDSVAAEAGELKAKSSNTGVVSGCAPVAPAEAESHKGGVAAVRCSCPTATVSPRIQISSRGRVKKLIGLRRRCTDAKVRSTGRPPRRGCEVRRAH